jgi:hypothetical protein
MRPCTDGGVSFLLFLATLAVLLSCLELLPTLAADECSYNNQLCTIQDAQDTQPAQPSLSIASPTNRQVFTGAVKLDASFPSTKGDSGICFKYVTDPDCRSDDAVRQSLANEQYVTCERKIHGDMQLASGCWILQFDSIAENKIVGSEFRSVTVAAVDLEVKKHYPDIKMVEGGELGIVQMAVERMMKGGLVLEFGTGRTTMLLSHFRFVEEWDTMIPPTEGVHTFDSFRGLPERWRDGFEGGKFSMEGVVPQSISELTNVYVHSGLVQETLSSFLGSRPSQPVGLLLLDMCLESATAYVLDQVACRLAKGSVVLFGNYFNYPGWVKTAGERTAWLSAVDRWGIDFEHLGYHASFLALQVTSKPKECPAPSLDIRPFRRLGNITVESFEQNYASPDVALPTIFENITSDVFDASRWTRQALMDVCGESKIVLRYKDGCSGHVGANKTCHHVRKIDPNIFGEEWGGLGSVDVDNLKIETVRDLLSLQDSENGTDFVLFDAPLLHHCPLARDWIRVPKYFSRDYYLIEDWMNGKDPVHGRNWPSIIVSKKGKGTFLHSDSGMTRFWTQQLSGSKKWRVFPPSENWRLYPTKGLHHFYPAFFKVDAMSLSYDKYPLMDGAIVYETEIYPGEVLFIPEGWAHQVLNLEDSISSGMNFLDNHCLESASKHGSPVLPDLVNAFFMPLDNPSRHSPEENIHFNDYFQFRFLWHEEKVPVTVKRWAQEKGKDVINSDFDTNGNPALHVAVYFDFQVVVKYLLVECGIDVNAKSSDGLTALDVAEKYGRQELRDMLIQFGGKSSVSD